MSRKHVIIPIFIPHKGCPFDCIYCNQKKISGQQNEMTIEKLRRVIEEHRTTLKGSESVEIAFYGGSFTGIEKEKQIKFLEAANEYIRIGIVSGIRISTRPDYISEEILEYLKYFNVDTIELGVQSLDKSVLCQSKRGHSIEDVEYSAKLIKNTGIKLGIQTMIGLPGDSKNIDIETAKRVITLRPDIVRIYPTLVIKDTYLEKMFFKGDYLPLSLDEAVDICSDLLLMYKNDNINVIRIGLQPTDNISQGMDVTAGPFHPAFRQLVESKLILRKIENDIINNKLYESKKIVIHTDNKNISNTIGQKKSNLEYLKQKYGFTEIRFLIE